MRRKLKQGWSTITKMSSKLTASCLKSLKTKKTMIYANGNAGFVLVQAKKISNKLKFSIVRKSILITS
jgi:hypothetical protein